MKRVISIILALCMCFSMSATAFAYNTQTEVMTLNGETYLVTITNDTVTVIDEKKGYQATYNQKTDVVSVCDLSDKESTVYLNLRTIKDNIATKSYKAASGTNSSRDNLYAYERSIIEYEENTYATFWELQIPDEIKMTWAHTNNNSAIDDFTDSVDELVEIEDELFSSVTTAVAAILLELIAAYAAPGIGAVIVSVFSSILGADDLATVLEFGEEIVTCQDNCEEAFDDVIVYTEPS